MSDTAKSCDNCENGPVGGCLHHRYGCVPGPSQTIGPEHPNLWAMWGAASPNAFSHSPTREARCDACWWHTVGQQCRRRAPLPRHTGTVYAPSWPYVRDDDGCGEFEAGNDK